MLNAMVELVIERGAGNVAVAHVVERAGVSRRTFYEIFDDREECFLAAFDDALARVSRGVQDAYDQTAVWTERIRAALVALLAFLDSELEVGRFLLIGSLGAGGRSLERRQRMLERITAVIDEGRGESKHGSQPMPLTAEGLAGGVLSVLHARLLQRNPQPLLELTGPLMSMIVLPYLGAAAARRELDRPTPSLSSGTAGANKRGDPLRRLEMRLTYRTVRVLVAVAAKPGGSNREIAEQSGITDQGQISKLLTRLQGLDLVQNTARAASTRGAPNAWALTANGLDIQRTIGVDTLAESI